MGGRFEKRPPRDGSLAQSRREILDNPEIFIIGCWHRVSAPLCALSPALPGGGSGEKKAPRAPCPGSFITRVLWGSYFTATFTVVVPAFTMQMPAGAATVSVAAAVPLK